MRILASTIITISICIFVMIFWLLTKSPLMRVVLDIEAQLGGEGSDAITLLKVVVDLWGVVVVVTLLATYGVMQAQKREWRGERYG